MVITKIETWKLERNQRFFDRKRESGSQMPWDVVVIRLTDDEGFQGEATALGARSGQITETYLHEVIAPAILGRNTTEREAIWHQLWDMDRHLAFFPIYLPGPIDVALWDMAAKKAQLPLHRYLGSCRSQIPAYGSGLFHSSIEEYVQEAVNCQGQGINAYKVHPGGPWQTDIEICKDLRHALGPDYVLMCDPVANYTLDQAIKVGRALEDLNFYWFEEPFRDFEVEKYARLCEKLDIPVANAEAARGGPWTVAQFITNRATDIVRADVSWKAGITGTLKVAHLAEGHGINCEIHTTTMGFMDQANLQVSCSIRNCEYFEVLLPEEEFRFPAQQGIVIEPDGYVKVSEQPGVGIDINWQLVDQCCTSFKVKQL